MFDFNFSPPRLIWIMGTRKQRQVSQCLPRYHRTWKLHKEADSLLLDSVSFPSFK